MAICGTKANWIGNEGLGFARPGAARQIKARQGLHAPAMVLVERSIAGAKSINDDFAICCKDMRVLARPGAAGTGLEMQGFENF